LALFAKNKNSREKRGWHTLDSDMKLSEMNLSKQIGYLNSSQKNTQFKKKIGQNRVREVKL
jgi:hypothetical protein